MPPCWAVGTCCHRGGGDNSQPSFSTYVPRLLGTRARGILTTPLGGVAVIVPIFQMSKPRPRKMRSLLIQLVVVERGLNPGRLAPGCDCTCPVSRAPEQRVRKTQNGQAGSTLRGGPCRSGDGVCGQSRVFPPGVGVQPSPWSPVSSSAAGDVCLSPAPCQSRDSGLSLSEPCLSRLRRLGLEEQPVRSRL